MKLKGLIENLIESKEYKSEDDLVYLYSKQLIDVGDSPKEMSDNFLEATCIVVNKNPLFEPDGLLLGDIKKFKNELKNLGITKKSDLNLPDKWELITEALLFLPAVNGAFN